MNTPQAPEFTPLTTSFPPTHAPWGREGGEREREREKRRATKDKEEEEAGNDTEEEGEGNRKRDLEKGCDGANC